MGKIESLEGIEARSGKIRITFHLKDGTRRRELINIPDTPKNRSYAIKLRAEIVDKIHYDTFNYVDYFPNSTYAKQHKSAHNKTIAQAADEWLTIRTPELALGTLQEYRNALNRHLLKDLGDKPFKALTYTEIKLHMAGLKLTPKTYNNVSGPIRGLLHYAFNAGYVGRDFSSEVKCAKNFEEPDPEPLTPDEVEAILFYMAEHYPMQIVNYFEFAIFAGPRPSEMIAIIWKDIDQRSGIARIKRARVRGHLKPTKTYLKRDIELHDRALAALIRQKEHTFMANAEVFHNPITGKPFYDTDVQVRLYWRPALKALGIRDRDARQTRHTCASMMLMADCNPAWGAKQLGHSIEMFLNVYADWIDGVDKGVQRQKFNSFSAPKLPQYGIKSN